MSNILTQQEAFDILRLDGDASLYPQLNIILPAIDDYIKTGTGKDWSQDLEIDPTAKIIANVLLVRWFEDPGMIGKVSDEGIISLVSQLHAKALMESDAI